MNIYLMMVLIFNQTINLQLRNKSQKYQILLHKSKLQYHRILINNQNNNSNRNNKNKNNKMISLAFSRMMNLVVMMEETFPILIHLENHFGEKVFFLFVSLVLYL